jgi:hypothetical protein
MISEIDTWRAVQLMLKRYGPQALDEESAARADELTLARDHERTTRCRIIVAMTELAN